MSTSDRADPDHTEDLHELRERASELRAELNAVLARITEIEVLADEVELVVPGQNAQVEGADVPEEPEGMSST